MTEYQKRLDDFAKAALIQIFISHGKYEEFETKIKMAYDYAEAMVKESDRRVEIIAAQHRATNSQDNAIFGFHP